MKLGIQLQEKIFKGLQYFSYLLYILIIFGLSYSAPKYLSLLNVYLPIYVSAFLLFRFNPWRELSFTEFDRQIVFQAGIFLLLTTSISTVLDNYFINPAKEEATKIRKKIDWKSNIH
jgi:hypothetical protein